MQVTTLDTLFVTRCSACVGGDVVRGKELLLSLSYPGLLGAGDPEGFRNSGSVQWGADDAETGGQASLCRCDGVVFNIDRDFAFLVGCFWMPDLESV
jgi:hypothetical protein